MKLESLKKAIDYLSDKNIENCSISTTHSIFYGTRTWLEATGPECDYTIALNNKELILRVTKKERF